MEPSTQTPRYAQLFVEGLKEANVTVVAAVPESLLAGVYRICANDNTIRYIPATNEAELPGICAGTYLAGKKGIMVMENSGLRQACEPIARFAYCHAMPLVMAMSFRGEWGERNWWGHNHAQTMEPIRYIDPKPGTASFSSDPALLGDRHHLPDSPATPQPPH